MPVMDEFGTEYKGRRSGHLDTPWRLKLELKRN